MSDAFVARGQALEDHFFHKRDQELLADLRRKLESQDAKAALRGASGIQDEGVLDSLVEMNIRAESLASLSLLPLIAVAWADGKMEQREKEAILQAAQDRGIESDSVGFGLVTVWLTMHPEPELLDVWKEYVSALKSAMKPEDFAKLKSQIMSQAKEVAESAGGILGIVNNISPIEKAKLSELEAAFG